MESETSSYWSGSVAENDSIKTKNARMTVTRSAKVMTQAGDLWILLGKAFMGLDTGGARSRWTGGGYLVPGNKAFLRSDFFFRRSLLISMPMGWSDAIFLRSRRLFRLSLVR